MLLHHSPHFCYQLVVIVLLLFLISGQCHSKVKVTFLKIEGEGFFKGQCHTQFHPHVYTTYQIFNDSRRSLNNVHLNCPH